MRPSLRVGVIGLGSIGRRHVGNLLALGCRVWGHDVNVDAQQRAQAEYRSLKTFRRSGAQTLDALVIATPWDMHLEWVAWAVREELPFFIEKPLGSLEQLPRWRELASLELPINQVGYMLRFHPVAQRLRDWGALGGRFDVRCDMASWPGTSYGPMLLEMSHEIDLALWCGAPTVVTDVRSTSTAATIGLGIGWDVELDARAATYWREWRVFRDRLGMQHAFDSPQALGDEMYRDELAHFLECVREQKPTRVPLSEGVKVLDVCAQVEAQCRSCA